MDLFFIAITGLAIGSFLNVLIDRLPQGESILGRSHCDYCGKNLSSNELIPVISFFWQKGKSRCCGKKLSWQYPIVEIITSVLFIIIFQLNYAQHLNLLPTILYLMSASSLIVITIADLKYQIIPDFALALLVISLLPHAISTGKLPQNFLAAIFLSGIMLAIFLATKGKGMGFGDVKFAFVIGLVLGLSDGFLALYLAFLAGGLIAVGMLFLKKGSLKSHIPFGPFMVLGTVIMLLFSTQMYALIHTFF